jgi:uncharacterized membrane protein
MRITDDTRVSRFGPESIRDISGGVFAFAMTLLILNLSVPTIPKTASEAQLAQALAALWPQILLYVVTVGLIGSYWIAHRLILNFIKEVDRTFLWMNLFFLMCVALVPFAMGIVGAYPRHRVALATYAGLSIVTLLVMYTQWRYATGRGGLIEPAPPEIALPLARKILLQVFICLLSIAVSFFSPLVSLLIFLGMPVQAYWPNIGRPAVQARTERRT